MKVLRTARGSSRLGGRRQSVIRNGSVPDKKQVSALYDTWRTRLIAYSTIFIIVLSYAVISDLIIGTARETVTYGCLVITTLLLIAAPLVYGGIRLRQRRRTAVQGH